MTRTDDRLRVTFISHWKMRFSRLPEIFSAADVHLTLIAQPDSEIAASPFIHHFIPLTYSRATDQDASFVNDLIATGIFSEPEKLGDWVIVADDKELQLLARSNLPDEVLARLLPARNQLGRSLFDSKGALARALAQLNIPQPQTQIAASRGELKKIVNASDTGLVIKADSGHGGTGVVLAPIPQDFDLGAIPSEWFPIVVQEFIDGDVCAVEAQFINGQLAGYLYSTVLETSSLFGGSTDRLFTTPPDDQVEQALATLGNAGALHGLANCSFIKDNRTGTLLLFEVDLRPNVWHQFGPKLGVDWISLFKNPPVHAVHNEGTQRVAHYPRSLTRAIRQLDFATLWMWLSRAPGTWDMRNNKDPVINRAEFHSLYRAPLQRILKKSLTAIPIPFSENRDRKS